MSAAKGPGCPRSWALRLKCLGFGADNILRIQGSVCREARDSDRCVAQVQAATNLMSPQAHVAHFRMTLSSISIKSRLAAAISLFVGYLGIRVLG